MGNVTAKGQIIWEGTFELLNIKQLIKDLILKNVISQDLTMGQTIVLSGDLGAGKTTFISAFCGHFGVTEVTSPTYALQHIYTITSGALSRQTIEHWDLYRINQLPDELLDPSHGAYRLIEWGEKFEELKKDLQISLDYIDDITRKIIITKWE